MASIRLSLLVTLVSLSVLVQCQNTNSSVTETSQAVQSSSSTSAAPGTSSSGPRPASSAPVVQPIQGSLEKKWPEGDPAYARTVAAICGGCGIFILNTVFFVVVSFLLRYNTQMERHKMPKVGRKSLSGPGGIFYNGAEVQSAQALFAPSLSATNIVSNASDIQLDVSGRVYHNRAFDAGTSQVDLAGAESPYKPIEIKSSQGVHSKA